MYNIPTESSEINKQIKEQNKNIEEEMKELKIIVSNLSKTTTSQQVINVNGNINATCSYPITNITLTHFNYETYIFYKEILYNNNPIQLFLDLN